MFVAVFVSGGPFGTEFQQNELVSKVKGKWSMNTRELRRLKRYVSSAHHSCYMDYAKVRGNFLNNTISHVDIPNFNVVNREMFHMSHSLSFIIAKIIF